MITTYKFGPLKFFLITFILSWISWGMAIYVSWQPAMQHYLTPLILGGLFGPAMCTLLMLIMSKNKKLWRDFFQRLKPDRINKKFILFALFLFPCQLLFAIFLSLFFGQPTNQFSIITQSTDIALQGINFLLTIFFIFLVGPFEEIGWRYANDLLRLKCNLLKTSLIFGVIWGLWHLPVFFVKNSAFQEIWAMGLLYTVVYFIDVILLAIILNWFYFKNNRSILIAIMFHSAYDICISIFHITAVTWYILMLILLLTAILIVKKNKELFFREG